MSYRSIIFLFLVLTSQISHAFSVEQYLLLKDIDRKTMGIYLKGLGEGFAWGETMSVQEVGVKNYYCPPENLAFGAEDYFLILDEIIKSLEKTGLSKINGRSIKDHPIEMLLIGRLLQEYPCSK